MPRRKNTLTVFPAFAGATLERIHRWNKTLPSPILTVWTAWPTLSQERITTFMRGISLRQVRLASGMVLFAYLVSHFLNHALGNISLEALAVGVYWHTAFWQFLPVAILFYTACAGAYRARHLGALRAPAIPLEGDRAAAARARPQRSDADHHPCHRRPARPDAVRTRKALSAGAVRLLDRGRHTGSG